MTRRAPKAEPEAVAAYFDAAPEPARSRLRALADVVRAEAPNAIERIAHGLATWHHGENLIHLGAFTNHVGIYPGPAAIVAFKDELSAFKTSKGAIQVPHDAPLPEELVRRLTRWRLAQSSSSPRGGATRPRPSSRVRGHRRDPAGQPALTSVSARAGRGSTTSRFAGSRSRRSRRGR